jgi:hypothetical protein
VSLNLPSLEQVKTLAQAIFTGNKVPDHVIEARLEVCRGCQFLRKDNHAFCGICKCRVSNPKTRLINLAAYEENLPKWGCKHPARRYGAGWPVYRSS